MSEHEPTRKKLAALAAGTLAPAEEAAVRAHLAACPDCAREQRLWERLVGAVQQMPEPAPSAARVARLAALAQGRREETLERRWNRLVLTGLVLYGWALFLVVLPLLPLLIEKLGDWLRLPWFAVVIVALGLWWSFCWVIGLALLPLLRGRDADLEEKVI